MTTLPDYISLLVQIPLVGIFVWFALRLVNSFQASLENRDAQWQAFLEEQRTAFHDALTTMGNRFGDEIRTLAKEVAELRGVINARKQT